MLTRQMEEPFGTLCVDFVGPLPRSKHGNTILLVFFDAFTNTWPTDPTSLPRPRGSSWESVWDTAGSTLVGPTTPTILCTARTTRNRAERHPPTQAAGTWRRSTERTPTQRLLDSSAIGEIFAAEVNRQGAEDVDLPLLGDDEYLEVLAAAGDVEVAQDLPWEQLDWVEIPAGWRTFGLGEMIPAVVLDAVGVALPKAMAKGPTKFVVEADGRRFQIRISRAGIVTAFLRPRNDRGSTIEARGHTDNILQDDPRTGKGRHNKYSGAGQLGSNKSYTKATIPPRYGTTPNLQTDLRIESKLATTTTTAATQCSHTPLPAAAFLCARVCHYGSNNNNSRNKVQPDASSVLVGSVSHSWVHHLTSPERDDSVPKSEPGGPGGRMRTTQRASGFSSSSSRGYSWTRILVGEP
ncbi:hypothetical protein ACLKA6_017766 [Drosophila palustris]